MMAWDAGLLTDPADEVHHRNHVRDDNRLENFEVLDGPTHALYHAEKRGVARNQYGTWQVKPREQRQTAPRPERLCIGCGQDVPLTLRRDAAFCSPNCRVRTWKRQHRKPQS